MKRIIAGLLVLLLLLTSCSFERKTGERPSAEARTQEDQKGEDDKKKEEEDELDQVKSIGENSLKFEDAFNHSVFKGFTDDQVGQLDKKGYLVLRQADTAIYHSKYEMANYYNVPVYITTDSVFNVFNIFYNESMKYYEATKHYIKLNNLAMDMVEDLSLNYHDAGKKYYDKALAYFYTAARLFQAEKEELNAENAFYDNTRSIVKEFSQAGERFEKLAARLGKEAKFKDMIAMSDSEIAKIKDGTMASSKLFGYDIDYSQFKPRGHYNGASLLRNYFKGVMFLSNPGFGLEDEDNLITAILISDMANKNQQVRDSYDEVYGFTSFYSGQSDDIGLDEMDVLVKEARGSDGSLDELMVKGDSKKIGRLKDLVKNMRGARIRVKTTEESPYDFGDNKQFRLMGQRYSLDQYVFSRLSEPVKKPQVSSLEFFTVLGDKKSKEVFYDYYKPEEKWEGYNERLSSVMEEYKANKKDLVSDDLYHGIISAIDSTLAFEPDPDNPAIPYYLKTDDYQFMQINSALGAFALLKHANVLYSKQMMAEMGGPEEKVLPHYVEPNLEVYEKLSNLCQMAMEGLVAFGYEDDGVDEYGHYNSWAYNNLVQLKRYMDLFVNVAQKELEGQKIEDEELLSLGWFGGMCDILRQSFISQFSNLGIDGIDNSLTSCPVVSDIATVLGGEPGSSGYLELGVGLPLDIYVLVEQNGRKALARGVLFSSYEFFSDNRLTDEEWHQMLGVENVEFTGYYEVEEYKDDMDLDLYMPYTKEFLNDKKNKIEIVDLELDWSN